MTATAEEIDFAGVGEPEDAPDFTAPDPSKSRRSRREYLFPPKDKEPPKARATKRRKPAPRAKKGAFIEPLEALYGSLAAVLMPFDPQCANVIAMSATRCAESMDELAYQNESVRRALTALTQTSALGAVIFAHAPIIMAVAVHHGPGGMQSAMARMAGVNPEDMPDDNA